MGRIFETRKATMFARWNKMAKLFTRITKDIVIAVKAGGPSPDTNPALRRALQNARGANMPKDKVDAAIKRASGQDQQAFEVVLYEGYAPHGVAVVVETATDNVVRTVANVRVGFKNHGGNMGTTGSVAFQFKKMGVFRLAPEGVDADALELDLIDHGLEEMGEGTGEKGEKQLVIRCAFADFGTLQAALEARKLPVLSADSEYVAQTP
ncbi:MAG: YebC/PmpR family DNA-binding transcriptional regulator, partial [Anaeromyxobacteraceae bacterium]|nr:YebC/PmpR family DNA-binding transcriptional regulator [Anaeromyxobacteraceae bacterium]